MFCAVAVSSCFVEVQFFQSTLSGTFRIKVEARTSLCVHTHVHTHVHIHMYIHMYIIQYVHTHVHIHILYMYILLLSMGTYDTWQQQTQNRCLNKKPSRSAPN